MTISLFSVAAVRPIAIDAEQTNVVVTPSKPVQRHRSEDGGIRPNGHFPIVSKSPPTNPMAKYRERAQSQQQQKLVNANSSVFFLLLCSLFFRC